MERIKDFIKGLDQRKVKIFLVFLICSFFAWFISKLSEPYESKINFVLYYDNLPDTLLVSKNAEKRIEAKVNANGFQFLYYNINPKKINLDLAAISTTKSKFYILKDRLLSEMEEQTPKNIQLIELDRDTLFFDLYQVTSKEVSIIPNITLQFDQNYVLEGKLDLTPATLIVKGPEKEIALVNKIMTEKIKLSEVSSDFSNTVGLIFPEGMTNSAFSATSTKISGTVVRFSEQIFRVEVKVVGVPEGFRAKTFPNTIEVLCKASIDRLKEIEGSDFEIVANYDEARTENTMFLNLQNKPEGIYDVRLLENQVEFILEKL